MFSLKRACQSAPDVILAFKRFNVPLKKLLSLSVVAYEALIDTDGGADK